MTAATTRNEVNENRFIAEKLTEVADLLEQQGAMPFRVNAYRKAAQFVAAHDMALRQVFEAEGSAGLDRLPTIGRSIAASIAEILDTGKLTLIARLRGQADPEKLFQTVPTVGPKLAQTLHEKLDVDTLEDLEAAAFDGRLAALKGIGPRRLQTLQHSLAEMLARRRPHPHSPATSTPPLKDILEIDRLYRQQAEAGQLPEIIPRRFNPTGAARLPILHAERGQWHFTALFSNTPNAQRYNRTRDWVVIYYARDTQDESQCTVVTAHGGKQHGKRVVRGYEDASIAIQEGNQPPARPD